MKNQELKGLSIEELQQRNEFTAVAEDSTCCEHCCETVIVKPSEN